MSQPPWMNQGAAPQAYAPPAQQQYAAQPQQLPQATAAASMHWINEIANAAQQGERLPVLSIGNAYVLDVDHFDEPTPSKDPARKGAVYFGAVFRVVESTDPSLPPGASCTKRENIANYGGPARAQALLQSALESFAQQRVELANVDQFKQAIAFAISNPCPLAGKSRVYAVVTASKNKAPDDTPYAEITWEPMPHNGTKGLVAHHPAPAQQQAPQAAGVFAGAPWQQGAPGPAQQTQGQPWAPQGTQPGPTAWPAGIVQTNGQGQR